MQQWLPLSTATFQAIIDIIPPPDVAQSQRIPYMLHPERAASSSTALQPTDQLEQGLYACEQEEQAQVVGYVSKMFAVARSELPENRRKEMSAEEMRQRGKEERERRAALVQPTSTSSNGVSMDGIEGLTQSLDTVDVHPPETDTAGKVNGKDDVESETSEALLAFSRIFSGTIHRGVNLIAILPKYDMELGSSHPRNAKYLVPVTARELYMMMGRDLVSVDSVPAGHICAIGGFEGLVHRNATLWAPTAKGVNEGAVDTPLVNLAGVSLQVSTTLFKV